MSQIKRGSSSITLTNYYNNEEVTIKLNPEYSPSLNAQSYYKNIVNFKIQFLILKNNSKSLLTKSTI
jgi:Predicted RNA-binding protein homologous to eukaryotic snRNP